jgi:diguanylate cyclase (GGDEF)-like protein/PAS domain S-box-containing protein
MTAALNCSRRGHFPAFFALKIRAAEADKGTITGRNGLRPIRVPALLGVPAIRIPMPQPSHGPPALPGSTWRPTIDEHSEVEMDDVQTQPKRTGALPGDKAGLWVPLLTFLLVVIAIGSGGVFTIEQYEKSAKTEAQVALDSITDLKINQIEFWLKGHREDAEAVAADPLLTGAIGSWMQAGRPADTRRATILARLQGIAHAHRYSAALIVDSRGSVVLSTDNGLTSLSPAAHDQALDAMRSGQVRWVDIHPEGTPGRFAMEFIVPVRNADGNRSAILFRIDPAGFLYPLIQSWPSQSKTAETFLFRQEGDAIVYLNALRHRNDAPLSLRYSANDPRLLAAQLVRGHEGVLEGEDYRGVPVVGYGHRIADSPWYLISKIDAEEIYAPIARRTLYIAAIVTGFILLSGLAIWLWWRRQRAQIHLDKIRAEVERQALARHYDFLTRYANDIILLADERGNIVEANDRAAATYGYAREELLGMNARRLRAEESAASFDDNWLRCARDGNLYETIHRRRDGSRLPVEISARMVQVENRVFHQAVIRDISERRRAESRMRMHASVFETIGEAVLITDAELRIVAVNPAFTEITGYDKAEVLGQTPRVLSSGRQDKAFYERMWASLIEAGRWQGEIWNRRKDGQVYPEWLSIRSVYDGACRVANYVAIFSDISERKAVEERITHLAQHDALTGLPNRVLMHDRLAQALAAARRAGDRVALMLIDLDRFKNVNDSLGHPAGDQLLQGVAKRLQGSVRNSDTVARLGGDEFVVILPKIAKAEDAAHVAEKMLLSLAGSFDLCGHDIHITPSIGVSIYPEDGADIDSLIRNADTAMYQAKENGRNSYQFFTQAMNGRVLERLKMETDLRNALARDEFVLHYQPQVDLKSGRVIGVEALVRWNSPKLGMVSPARFIPVAEESGLIIPLGEWILHSACEQRRRWEEQGILHFPVSVNVSSLQFRDRDFDRIVARVLGETGLAPALLDLELTESAVMHHGEETVGLLQRLKTQGVALSIDDFGTGYSSLGYLKRFPIDRLKIDQSFIRDLMTDANDVAIVKAVIALGHSLGLRVIAEGVETADQFALLMTYDCDECQGYLIGRPVAAEELGAVLRSAGQDGSNVQLLQPAAHAARQRNAADSVIPFPDRRHIGVSG